MRIKVSPGNAWSEIEINPMDLISQMSASEQIDMLERLKKIHDKYQLSFAVIKSVISDVICQAINSYGGKISEEYLNRLCNEAADKILASKPQEEKVRITKQHIMNLLQIFQWHDSLRQYKATYIPLCNFNDLVEAIWNALKKAGVVE